MYKLMIDQADGSGAVITQKDPHVFLRACSSAIRLMPKGSVVGMVMTQSKEIAFDVTHLEQTIQRPQFLPVETMLAFMDVVNQHPDYEKLRASPFFTTLNPKLERLDQFQMNVAIQSLRQIVLLYAVREGLITEEQLLHFVGFPIRSDITF